MGEGVKRSALRALPILVALVAVVAALVYLLNDLKGTSSEKKLRVVAYSSFISSWGPGPEIGSRFKEKTGIEVEFQDGGDAGLLLKKLELFPADVVIGFDQATVADAAQARPWKKLNEKVTADIVGELQPRVGRWMEEGFVPYDWAPMAFIYREGEIEPPQSLDDLLDERFRGAIALQDPRMSTPGLQFLLWVVGEYGMDDGFKFLERLKSNVHSVSEGWSASYGLFTKRQAKMVFSYLTSPLYHILEENDRSYKAAIFRGGHVTQVEFVGVPESCKQCEDAEKFVNFMLEPEIQAVIMRKNFMLPVVKGVAEDVFAELPASIGVMDFDKQAELMKQKDELFSRWQSLGW